MKLSKIIAGLALSATCAAASAGVMTVYQNSNSIAISSNSDNVFTKTFLSSVPSNSILVDFSVSFAGSVNTSNDNNDFLGLWFGYDVVGTAQDKNIIGSHTDGPNIGVKVQSGTASDLFNRNTGTGANFLTGGAIATGASYHVFGHLYKSVGSSTYNRFDAWVNPSAQDLATLTAPDAHATEDSGISAINAFGFRSANLDIGDTITISDLRIQAVPEPTSLALLGLGLVGLAALRRRTLR